LTRTLTEYVDDLLDPLKDAVTFTVYNLLACKVNGGRINLIGSFDIEAVDKRGDPP
jgi:hypothetical protein